MSDSLESLQRELAGAGELQSVVRTMKALAAASIGQYEAAVRSLVDYYRAVELGLAACVRVAREEVAAKPGSATDQDGGVALVFGSDQGLIGQFNEVLTEYVTEFVREHPSHWIVWAVGERMEARLADAGLNATNTFVVPNSVGAITPLVGRVLIDIEHHRAGSASARVILFHNQPRSGAIYEPVRQRLLPLDRTWRQQLSGIRWPTGNLPEVIDRPETTLPALVREYLFVSLYRACAESLASENASRLAAMQRAEKNINELLEDLGLRFHQLRQTAIDEELFDLVSGFEALAQEENQRKSNADVKHRSVTETRTP